MAFNRKSFKNFKSSKPQTTEEKIKSFVLRNSKNGYYTKVSTLSYKFEISEDRVWGIVGELLDEGLIESIHDQKSGEMKLCETGKMYVIMDLEQKRQREKYNESKKTKKPR